MRTFILLLTMLVVWPASAQKSKGKTAEIQPVIVPEGITYSLPRTGIRMVFKARQTVIVAGPFALYADQLLGIKDAVTQQQTSWEICNVSFIPYAEPDPEQVYKTVNLAAPLLQLTSQGCLAGYNTKSVIEDHRKTTYNSFLKMGTDRKPVFKNMVMAGSSGLTPVGQLASEAAAQILKIRAAKHEIVSGMLDEFHPDGKAYEESLDELRKMEKELLELFTGTSESEDYTFVYEFLPPSKAVKGEVICRFDENLGFLEKNDFSGKPIMIDVQKEEPLPAGTPDATAVASGIYYRLPGMGIIRLTSELTVIGSARMTIAQFGKVLPFPAELLNDAYSVEFHPETGALKNISKK